MIAGDDDDVEWRHPTPGFSEELVELALSVSGRVRVIENVAGDQQGVDLFGFQRVQQPVEKTLLFVTAVEIVQGLAQMPV